MATIAGEIHFSSAYVEHDVTDISQAADAGCIYNGQSPAVAVGDKLAIASTTALYGWPVSIDAQGFVSIDTDGDNRTDTAAYYVWDDTDDTWGAVGEFERHVTPTLTAASGAAAGATTATLSVATDNAEGTVWAVVTTSATTPSHAQIKLGQTHTGAAAAWAGSDAAPIATTTFNASGLSASTAYYAHFAQENDASTPDEAAPVSSAEFTTTTTASTGLVKDVAQSVARSIAQSGAQ